MDDILSQCLRFDQVVKQVAIQGRGGVEWTTLVWHDFFVLGLNMLFRVGHHGGRDCCFLENGDWRWTWLV
eukprot:scaffold37799_cov176-Amphora_coffeaeformis.AAC.8